MPFLLNDVQKSLRCILWKVVGLQHCSALIFALEVDFFITVVYLIFYTFLKHKDKGVSKCTPNLIFEISPQRGGDNTFFFKNKSTETLHFLSVFSHSS